jgi:hypothetical protein
MRDQLQTTLAEVREFGQLMKFIGVYFREQKNVFVYQNLSNRALADVSTLRTKLQKPVERNNGQVTLGTVQDRLDREQFGRKQAGLKNNGHLKRKSFEHDGINNNDGFIQL